MVAVNERGSEVHAVCVPFPLQGHITPMLQLAKLLNSKGFYITFVNTEHNQNCMVKSNGPNSFKGTSSFKFETFPDGLPVSNTGSFREVHPLIRSLRVNCPQPFMNLLHRINDTSGGSPPITLIISDIFIPFARNAAYELGNCSLVMFYPPSACSLLAYAQLDTLLDKDILPFKDPNFTTNGSLNMELNELSPSMNGIRLKDFPSLIRSTEKDHRLFKYFKHIIRSCDGVPLIFSTFEALDREILDDLSKFVAATAMYTIGPLHCIANNLAQENDELGSMGFNLWKEDTKTLEWLDSKKPNSVIYVSFGTTSFLTNEQLVEFSWGLANSKYNFLWIVRPDIVKGGSSIIPPGFLDEVKDRAMLTSWCAQEKVLKHPSIKVYLSHSGWNSILESTSSGVPLICWPSYADQPTNCWFACKKMGVALEMEGAVERGKVEEIIREAMDGEKGKEIKKNAMEWKRLSEEAISSSGSSSLDCDRFVDYALSLKKKENGFKLV
ncbi:hypothetical protein RND81_08G066800 [Saponaria officinalis]|uniref:2-hydroxyflavanone C-glucosyltransferase n=1 Tax=Saponaria officinalis TaxID=3572 RepID=A0AAW1J5W4_SAPOF